MILQQIFETGKICFNMKAFWLIKSCNRNNTGERTWNSIGVMVFPLSDKSSFCMNETNKNPYVQGSENNILPRNNNQLMLIYVDNIKRKMNI